MSCFEGSLPLAVRSIRLVAGGLDLLIDEVSKRNVVLLSLTKACAERSAKILIESTPRYVLEAAKLSLRWRFIAAPVPDPDEVPTARCEKLLLPAAILVDIAYERSCDSSHFDFVCCWIDLPVKLLQPVDLVLGEQRAPVRCHGVP